MNMHVRPSAVMRYTPQSPTLAAYHRDQTLIVCIVGPLGSGKTMASASKVFHAVDTMPKSNDGVRRSRVLVIRATYKELESTTIPDWLSVVPEPLGVMVWGAPPTHTLRYRRHQDQTVVESEVIFFALDQFDKPADKVRGFQISFAWINEGKEVALSGVRMVVMRTGRFPAKAVCPTFRRFVILDTNAPPEEHWLGQFRRNPPPGWSFHNQPPAAIKVAGRWVVNPKADNLHNLPDDYYTASLYGNDRQSDDWIRANLANEGVMLIPGKPVHPDFSQSFHVAEGPLDVTPGYPIYYGVDYGRTPAMVMLQHIEEQWLVLREIVSFNASAEIFGDAVKPFIEREEFRGVSHWEGYGDPAGSDMAQTRDETPMDVLIEKGLPNLQAAPSNDYESRFQAVDRLLRKVIRGKPAIIVDPRCKTLIRGLAGAYNFKLVATAVGEQLSLKPNKTPESHVCEALQYVLLGAGESDLLGLSAGDIAKGKVGIMEIENDEDFDGWKASYTGVV